MTSDTEIPASTAPALVVARPSQVGNWCGAAFFGISGVGLLIGFLMLGKSEPSQRLTWYALGLVVSAPLLLIASVLALWTGRARVIADDFGLRWRSIGRWRIAAWEDVTDYYYQRLPNKNKCVPVVETRSGRLPLGSDLIYRDALLNAIAARTVRARARSWGEKGMRPEDDWPRTFGYDTPDNRFLPWLMGACLVGAIAATALLAIPKTLKLAPDIGWPLAVCAGLLMLMMFAGTPVALVLALLPVLTETRRRKEQTISVDLNGLRYQCPEGEIAVRWDEVKGYYFGSATGWVKGNGPAVVATTRGAFDFIHTLQDRRQLRQIIQRYATRATTQEWRGEDLERLGGETACWTGGSAGVGQRLYHYRTRTNRALVGMAGGYWLAWCISAGVGPLRERLATGPGWVFGSGIGLTATILWLIWRYKTAAILVDERGISQRAWNSARFIAWSEVEEVAIRGAEGFRFGTVTGGGRCVRFWLGIADVDELLDTLPRRAPDAAFTRWKNRELD